MPANLPALVLITGASRGMGAAIALQCLRDGHHVIAIARQPSVGLEVVAPPGALVQWQTDLADAVAVSEQLRIVLRAADAQRFSAVTLINNAGVIAPLKPLSGVAVADTVRALRVGLEAPMLLTTAFLAGTSDWQMPRKVLNISSGLGRRAMAGSASYCAAKAGMDHFSRAVALEEAAKPNGARIVSLAPGVIDTDMQTQLRGADPAQFSAQADFANLKAEGKLLSPEAAATKVLAYLARPDFGSNPVADVRDPA